MLLSIKREAEERTCLMSLGKKDMLQVAGILCVEIAESDIFWKRPPWTRLSLFPVHEVLVKFPSKGCSMPQSWRQFLDQPAAVESDVAPGANHGSPENIPASYSIFLFDKGSFKKKTRGSLKACTTSAFSAAWHQQAQSQIRFYKRFGSLMYMACKLMDNIFWKWYGSSFAS